ncbi:hypothetical protein TELCIR_14036 [Teladorsagia circumcincta]|uniref:Peptidase M12A domain-containing protein n=1 Tax=Teladorsagia circumcincta TaxID=45464 RepID=A0A2G9U255_TELCI|nr:hypothetical protein TELCIR_14036 [Teladorsagia circumcincta]
MDDTCIDFQRKRGEGGDLINVFKGWNCWSQDGRQGGLQFVSYNTDCGTIGTIAREIGRAIGLDKAHSIYDRDLNCTDEENTNPPGCGESLEATVEWTPLEDKLDGEKGHEERDGYKRCNYWIKVRKLVNCTQRP